MTYSLDLFARLDELRNKILLTELLLKRVLRLDTTVPACEKFLSLADEVAITEKTCRATVESVGNCLSLDFQ